MSGILKMMVAIAVLVAATYGLIYMWTGVLPEHGLKILGTLGVITIVSMAILLLSKPTGSKP